MKKRITVFAILLCLTMLLSAGCISSAGNGNSGIVYTAYIHGQDNLNKKPHPYWNEGNVYSFQDPSAPKEISVTFNGETYTGKYVDSVVETPKNYIQHNYSGDIARFSINSKTGELVDYMLKRFKPGVFTATADDFKQTAENIASKYIKTEDFKLEIESVDDNGNSYHKFKYYKEVNGIITSEYFKIGFYSTGELYFVETSLTGLFDNMSFELDYDKAEKVLEERLHSLYDASREITDWEIKTKRVVGFDKNMYGIFYSVYVDYKVGGGTNGELVCILVSAERAS